MKAGTENRQKTLMAGVLGVLALGACIYLYEQMFGDSTPAPAPAPVIVTVPVKTPGASGSGGKAKVLPNTAAALDPTLHMGAMLVTEQVEYAGTGRNIFSMTSAPAPVDIPKPIAVARINTPPPPPPPPPVPQTCPPTCPPIPLKFFGTITSAKGTRQAFLLSANGEDVFPAAVGDIVMRRYKVISISANSIQIEDMPNGNKQMLPLLAN